jgi:hypothetical protein
MFKSKRVTREPRHNARGRLALCAALALSSLGCASPSKEECMDVCTHVVRVVGASAEGATSEGVEGLVRGSAGMLGDCVQSCQSSSQSHVKCLAGAQSVRQLNDCNRD